MTSIDGAVTVVTGASRGIGVPIAKALAHRGARVALAARSAAELEQLRAGLAAAGHDVIAVTCDVGNPDDRRRLVERTVAELGPIDILVNNAGIEATESFSTGDPAEMTRILTVNLDAPMQLTRMVLAGMLDRNRGHIVNISSAAGKIAPPFMAPYAASKAGLVAMSHSLRAEYDRTDVHFSVICPAFVTDTGMYDRWERQGVRSGRLAGRAKLNKVVDAVVNSIERNRSETLVNTPPIKPLVVLGTVAPSLTPRLFRAVGFRSTLERAMALRQQPPR